MYAKWQGIFFLFWRILASMAGKVSSTVTVFWCGHLSLRLRPSALFSHIQEARFIPFSLDKGWNLDAETSQRKHEHQIGSEIQHSTLHGVFLISQPLWCSKQIHRKGHILRRLSMGMNISWRFSGIEDSAQIFLQWVEKGRKSTLGCSRCTAADLVGLFMETPFSICLVPHPSSHLLLPWSWATFTHSDNAPDPLQGLIWFVQR